MGIATDLSCPRGQARTYTASASPAMAISGWNFAFTIRTAVGGQMLAQVTSGNGITVTDPVNGVLSILLTAALTLWPPKLYYWDLWRTDPGNEDQLASGSFTITGSYRV